MNRDLLGLIEIGLIDATGETMRRSFMVDTGFNGWLGLSDETLGRLDAWPIDEAGILLGDGSERRIEQFLVSVLWQDDIRVVTALKSGIDLVGMKMLYGNRLTMGITRSGSIEIAPI